jgi:hypothetical protein
MDRSMDRGYGEVVRLLFSCMYGWYVAGSPQPAEIFWGLFPQESPHPDLEVILMLFIILAALGAMVLAIPRLLLDRLWRLCVRGRTPR